MISLTYRRGPRSMLVSRQKHGESRVSVEQDQKVQALLKQSGGSVAPNNDKREHEAESATPGVSSEPMQFSSLNNTERYGLRDGEVLSGKLREDYEQKFNTDLSSVRLFRSRNANRLAESLDANAFTLGSNIVFGQDRFAPSSSEGRRLLAHELTHVVQQANGAPRQIQRSPRPWPLNGRVINNSDQAVRVWSDDRGFYEIGANSTSSRFGEDVDYIQDRHGRWYKIGPNTVTVDANGQISGHQCPAWSAGGECLPGDRFAPPDFNVV